MTRVLGLTGSLGLCLCSWGLALSSLVSSGLPSQWVPDYLTLLGFASALTILIFFIRGVTALLFLWALQVFLVALLNVAGPGFFLIPSLLTAGLALEAAALLPTWPSRIALAALGVVFLLVQHWNPDQGKQVRLDDLGKSVAVLFCIGFAAALVNVAKTTTKRNLNLLEVNETLHEAVLQLTSANTAFLEHASIASQESAIAERNRITRELHDVIGQTLTNIIMMMDAIRLGSPMSEDETQRLVQWVRQKAKTGLEETRAALYELRSFRPERLRGLKALKNLIDTFSKLSKIKILVHWGNLPWQFSEEVEEVLYRLIQEALSNSFRHGLADQVEIRFHVIDEVLNLLIRDNGRGGPDTTMGLGQSGMSERLNNLGGMVVFRSQTTGYSVVATIPLAHREALL